MHCLLLLVASTMGNKENLTLQLLARALPVTHLPTCDVFLAPSSIPGSADINIQKKTNVISRAVWVAALVSKHCLLNQLVASLAAVYLNNPLISFLSIVLRHLKNVHLDFNQLGSEFLQAALSTKMR